LSMATTVELGRKDSHNAAVDPVLVARGRCGSVHLPTGRRCTRPSRHEGGCVFVLLEEQARHGSDG
jgi:hypothetical protein